MQAVIIDTSIIVSTAITGKGNPAEIMKLVSEGKLKLCYNVQILSEYTEVLSRDKFNFSITWRTTRIFS